jgi:hypothetical protein
MIGLTTTGWWVLGYAVGGAVVLVAATLLILIIVLARRIVRQTGTITLALDGAMRNTTPLYDIGLMNHALESITRGLKQLAGEEGSEDERGILRKITSFLSRRV